MAKKKAAKRDWSKVLLVEHVRRGGYGKARTECTAAQNRRIGVLVAGLRDGRVYVGACKCRASERFDARFGQKMALTRMERAAKGKAHPVAWSLEIPLAYFAERCKKFFEKAPKVPGSRVMVPPLVEKGL